MMTSWLMKKALHLCMLSNPTAFCWVPFINLCYAIANGGVELELETF